MSYARSTLTEASNVDISANNVLISMLSASVAVECSNPNCRTPVAAIMGNSLVIKSRHHGEHHVTVINLIALASALAFGT